MAASVQASRFALLTVDDDVDSGEDTKSKASGNKAAQQASSAKKKKNKKKKAEQQKAENDELRSLAFGKGGKGKAGGKPQGHGAGEPPQQQWEQWKQRDNTFASETYEQDLQQALLLSKLEFEEHKEVRQAIGDLNGQANQGGKEKKKKKKDKPAAMSLEQFSQMVDKEQGSGAPDEEEWTLADESPSPKVVIPVQESDPKFFRRVEEDVTKILQKEKIQEEYRKQYVVESARSQQYQAAIEKRDKEITMLRASSDKMQEELNQVKKRNQQLCHILAQGEMKDKRSVLVELEELQQVRDELTQTVGELTTELEKERSKVHALKAELDKVKPNQGGRSGGKN